MVNDFRGSILVENIKDIAWFLETQVHPFVEGLKDQINTSDTNVQDLENRIEELEGELEEANNDIDSYKEDIEQLSVQVRKLINERDDLIKKVSELEQIINNYKEKCGALI